MQRPQALTPSPAARLDRIGRASERTLRRLGDVRLGIGLLLLAGAVNAVAAATGTAGLLAAPPYLALLGAVLVTGLAAVAVRAPVAWREWRRPSPLDGRDLLRRELPVGEGLDPAVALERAAPALRAAGYRVAEIGSGGRAALAGVARGWAPFVGLVAHLAVLLIVIGAGIGLAFGHEETFSLLPGEQALLDAPRAGQSDAIRLDRFDAAFGADGRPERLDTHVTFLRGGTAVETATLRVNAPGSFGGYLVHGWTYGPAVRLRVTTLGGRPLLDAALPLEAAIGGMPGAFAELPTAGVTLGISLADAGASRLRVTAAGSAGLLDSATLVVGGGPTRVGPAEVTVEELTSYVTFLSRRDPGMGILFAGAAALVASLAVALWLPRRRVSVRVAGGMVLLALRGGRLEDPSEEADRVAGRIAAAMGGAP